MTKRTSRSALPEPGRAPRLYPREPASHLDAGHRARIRSQGPTARGLAPDAERARAFGRVAAGPARAGAPARAPIHRAAPGRPSRGPRSSMRTERSSRARSNGGVRASLPSSSWRQEKRGHPALGPGDRALASLRAARNGTYEGRIIRRIGVAPALVLGRYERIEGQGRILPVERGKRTEFVVESADAGEAQPGELVQAEVLPARPPWSSPGACRRAPGPRRRTPRGQSDRHSRPRHRGRVRR